jgi:hypothetical protein
MPLIGALRRNTLAAWYRAATGGGACLLRVTFCLLLALSAAARAAQDDWQGVERIIAVGDIHGDYGNYIKVLRQAGVIDRRGRWAAGETHLVQLGDIPDRGPDTARVIGHLQELEAEALQAGGRVHALIGNHEAMNITGDLRYVHPGEYSALKSRNAERLRERYYARVVDALQASGRDVAGDEAFEAQWLEQHPLGYVEHRQHWHPDGEFGAWVRAHNSAVRINRTLFVHGGISPAVAGRSMESINAQIREELAASPTAEAPLLHGESSPLWYRGLARGEETEELAAHLEAVLKHFDVDRVVVGHTPGFATIVPRYDARFIVADSGISAHYGGYLASLLIEDGALFTIQRGQRIPFPGSNAELLRYYRAVDKVEPGVNNLRYMIQVLQEQEGD